MAEQELKKAIQERIQKEKEDILIQAKKEAGQIIKEAQDEAFPLRESYVSNLKKTCLIKKMQGLSQINLEAQKMLLEEKEKKILEVFVQAHNNFTAICQDKDRYRQILRNFLQEAQDGLGKDSPVELKVNPADKELVSEAIKELKLNARLETNGAISGGLELLDLDGAIIIVNTFKSRLEKTMPILRQEIGKILF